jgi:hypothetical protein
VANLKQMMTESTVTTRRGTCVTKSMAKYAEEQTEHISHLSRLEKHHSEFLAQYIIHI